jgi:hypothetical protein
MKTMKFFLKNAVLALIMIALLIGFGVYLINGISDVEMRKSTYTRTDFDYYIASPDKKQVQNIEANPAVDRVFPFYVFSRAFSADDDLLLIASDDMEDHGISIFSDEMLIEGRYDPSGAMLDMTAAETLGVSVGDTVSFSFAGQRIKRTVSGIYLPSTLAIMEEGVVLVAFDQELSRLSSPKAYGGAFVSSHDRDGVAALLNGYVGEGNVTMTFEAYVARYCGEKLPNQTDEAYQQECREKYAAYREELLASAMKDRGQVMDKREGFNLIQEQVLTSEKNQNSIRKLAALAVFAVYTIISLVFVINNRANDRIRRDMGLHPRKMLRSYTLISIVTSVLIASVTTAALIVKAGGSYFASSCMGIVALFACVPLAALLPIFVITMFYVNMVYGGFPARR